MIIWSRLRALTRRPRDENMASPSLSTHLRHLVDRHFPSACVLCGRRLLPVVPPASPPTFSRAFCQDCEAALPWWRAADGCPRCGSNTSSEAAHENSCPQCLADGSPLHQCRTLLRYEADLRRLIPAFKQPSGTLGPAPDVTRAIDHLLDAFANHLAKEAPTGIPGVDLITSLPLHPRRLRRRGFNQADLLAKRIADARCLPFMHNILTRIHDTLPQASLTGEARRHNVQGAFAAARLPGPNLRIAVVDDVLTTGSSLAAAADALLEAGALEVVGITLAATLPARARRPQMR